MASFTFYLFSFTVWHRSKLHSLCSKNGHFALHAHYGPPMYLMFKDKNTIAHLVEFYLPLYFSIFKKTSLEVICKPIY